MPKVGSEHKKNRRIQILKAAFSCFSNKGFHQTSMRDICEQSGLSTGAVYNYFDGKEDIIEALGEESRSSTNLLFEDIKESDSRETTIQKIIRKLCDILIHQHESGELIMKIRLWNEALRSEKIKSVFKENLEDIESKIADYLDQHTVSHNHQSELSNDQIAKIIVSTYQGLVVQKALNNEIDTENCMGHLAYLLTN